MNREPSSVPSDLCAVFVPGILNIPALWEWTDSAKRIWKRWGGHAKSWEYFSGIFRVFQGERARALAKTFDEISQPRVMAVGHSNGTELIIRACKLMKRDHIDCLVLIAGACDENFERNGLNDLIAMGRVGTVFVWFSQSDEALGKWATFSRRVARALSCGCLGYGLLGLVGPQTVSPIVAGRVHGQVFNGFGHGDYFVGSIFNETMDRLRTIARSL